MKLYIDESGSITTVSNKPNRFFVLSLVETENPRRVAQVFKRSKQSYIDKNPGCGFSIKDEIKGSEMPNNMKKYIFNALKEKTDIKMHYIIFDNWNAVDRLRRKPSIAFNYLMFLKLRSIFNGRTKGIDLELKLDNRNCSVYGLNSLQEYLEIEFCLKSDKCVSAEVKYHESDRKELIQIADIFSNTLFKVCKFHKEENAKLIEHYYNNLDIIKLLPWGSCEFFPRKCCEFDFIS